MWPFLALCIDWCALQNNLEGQMVKMDMWFLYSDFLKYVQDKFLLIFVLLEKVKYLLNVFKFTHLPL